MNIAGFYIPDRPFCIICGYESDDLKKVQKHVEDFHPKYHAVRCGEISEKEKFTELRKARMVMGFFSILDQLNNQQREELFKMIRDKMGYNRPQ